MQSVVWRENAALCARKSHECAFCRLRSFQQQNFFDARRVSRSGGALVADRFGDSLANRRIIVNIGGVEQNDAYRWRVRDRRRLSQLTARL